MKQYIDKDALVAEIEGLQDSIKATAIDGRISKEQAEAYKVCVKLRSFVEDTLKAEKIYLCSSDIEKIVNYLNSRLYDWVSITNPDQRSCANVIPREDFIEDFKNYMKEE